MYYGTQMSIYIFDISGNPYKEMVDDDIVQRNYKEYSGEWDKGAADCGFPDKFMYETVKDYLWQYRYSLAPVSKNVIKTSKIIIQLTYGNCN